jgi:alkaline phosphatase
MPVKNIFAVLILFISCTVSKPQVYQEQNIPIKRVEVQKHRPKNIIFLIGDGMGLTQITAGMYMNKNQLELERMPIVGIHKSYSADDLITDSAAGATAFSIGHKTKNGYLGVDSLGRTHTTILEECSNKGFATGLVATSTIVHATPAAFLSHQSGREDYEAIAMDYYINGNCDILIGGGKKYFDRRVKDSINLIEKLMQKGYTVNDYFQDDFQTLQIPNVNKYIFYTADGDPLPASQGRNYLAKAGKDAIQFLNQKNKKGFFLMIEGSQIDWGGHANTSEYIVSEVLDFNKVIKEALDFAIKDKNTLVVVTADHETGGYTINPGSKMDSLVTGFSTKKHTAAMIPVFAFGPGAENFSGIYENTAIYYKIRNLLF